MIKDLATIAKTKLWFATVNKYREYEARKKLNEYMASLSPKNREWAQELRAQLDTATPDQAVGILRRESAAITEKQMRVIERIDAVTKSITVTE